ncbi:hypothetical protein K461DRAFT_212001, partial [Myriangium duriaei CBS 260.36]
FCIPVIAGGFFEIIGFLARMLSYKNVASVGLFVIQTVLILLAPILFVASIYVFLARIIGASGFIKYCVIRINWLSKIFIAGDIICFLVQGVGATKFVHPKTQADFEMGRYIVLTGLGLQLLLFAVFIATATIFHRRLINNNDFGNVPQALKLGQALLSVYIASLLITVRNAYRFVEYASGNKRYLFLHEWPLYVLD